MGTSSKDFDRQCGVLYDRLLKSAKKKVEVATHVDALMEVLWSTESPLCTGEAPSNMRKNVYCRPMISRAIQMCLKMGSTAQKVRICEQLRALQGVLCTSAAGYHLLTKVWLYCPKVELPDLISELLRHPQVYFTKYGAKVWDYACSKRGNAGLRKRILTELFLRKFCELQKIDCNKGDLDELLVTAAAQYPEAFKEAISSKLDVIIKKELLSSHLCHHWLALLCKSQAAVFDTIFVSFLADLLLEGSTHLLGTKEGVTCLCKLAGHWNAKQKKTFLGALKSDMQLSKLSWRDYWVNDVTRLFLCRFLETMDDTKISCEQILPAAFACRIKDGEVFFDEEASSLVQESLSRPEVGKFVLRLVGHEKAHKYFTEHENLLLAFVSPASKKDADKRRQELRDNFFGPWAKKVLDCGQFRDDETNLILKYLREMFH